jgi:uncharacterized protein
MRFVVEEIPESGMELTRDLETPWVAPLVGPQFHTVDATLRLVLSLTRSGHSVAARGHLTGPLGFICSRCAEEAPFQVDHEFSHLFVEAEDASGQIPEDVGDVETLESTEFEGREIDLEPLVAEELVLSLPTVPLCSEDCKGVCQRCGSNRNEGDCGCDIRDVDPRWEQLRDIKL